MTEKKKREPLKYKVAGGLEKISNLYRTMDEDPQALDACWEKPHSFLRGLVDAEDIQLSSGYKQLADSMGTLDLRDICKGYSREQIDALQSMDSHQIDTLLKSTMSCDGDLEFRMGGLTNSFPTAVAVAVAVVAVSVTVSTTSLSGRSEDISDAPVSTPPTLGMIQAQKMEKLTSNAQAIADHLGWYTKQ